MIEEIIIKSDVDIDIFNEDYVDKISQEYIIKRNNLFLMWKKRIIDLFDIL